MSRSKFESVAGGMKEIHGHSFKQMQFKKFTWCDLCGDFIWGLTEPPGYKCQGSIRFLSEYIHMTILFLKFPPMVSLACFLAWTLFPPLSFVR